MARAAQITMYTKSWCGYCAAAKRLLKKKDAGFTDIDVDSDQALFQEMIERSGGRTVPQIFINGQSVGGYTDLAALDSSGELDTLLDQPPA
jgi:glutaredoxin 3